jgi:CBS domain-containing protein
MNIFAQIRQWSRRKALHKQIAKLRQMTVGDIMTKYVITIRPEDDVIKAATKMIAEDISCLVVTEGEKPVGLISERDFLRKVPLSKQVFSMKVKDIMSANLTTVPPTMKLTDAVALMKEKNFRRLIVMQDRMVGVVTQTNFTKTLGSIMTSYPITEPLQLKAIMTKSVLTVTPKDSVSVGKQKMMKANVGAIAIMDKETVMGIFTEYDILMQFYDQHGKLEMADIGKYMRKYVRAMPADASVFEANRLMLEKNMRRLLIVDGTKVLGIVTQTDICRFTYCSLDVIEKAANQNTPLRHFAFKTEIHGEFRGEHLKVYELT